MCRDNIARRKELATIMPSNKKIFEATPAGCAMFGHPLDVWLLVRHAGQFFFEPFNFSSLKTIGSAAEDPGKQSMNPSVELS
jgi:hypothetical protein